MKIVSVLISVGVLNEGFNSENVEVVIMARPTLSLLLYIQCIGRGTRWYEGKKSLIVVDMVDNYSKHSDSLHNSLKDGAFSFCSAMRISGYSLGKPMISAKEVSIIDSKEEILEVDYTDLLKNRLNSAWTKTEENILRKYYPTESKQITKRLLTRTLGCIMAKAHTLGIKVIVKTKLWSCKKDNVIIKYFQTEGVEKVAKRLNMSEAQVRSRIDSLKFTKGIVLEFWSKSDDKIIIEYHSKEHIQALTERLLARTKKYISVGRVHSRILALMEEGLIPDTRQPYTEKEEEFLIKYYPIATKEFIISNKPGYKREWLAIQSYCISQLQLRRNYKPLHLSKSNNN